ncbi:MAG: hypothetical protein DI595_22750 [Agrobacterium fabrum]|uniref:Uncharacterized protein n=1 Tax=Agrobacterium fabrum TaxID=1176649 RepID=A0A2W5EHC7_9HYPH|nr:MAG: hypothetical protein DI595_22750 [Agrobacterium fabrum]
MGLLPRIDFDFRADAQGFQDMFRWRLKPKAGAANPGAGAVQGAGIAVPGAVVSGCVLMCEI